MNSQLFFSSPPSLGGQLQDLTGGAPRPRFWQAASLMAYDLVHKARVEVQIDADALAEFDDQDHEALDALLMVASSMGRPFVGLAFQHDARRVALVSYDPGLDDRDEVGFYPQGFRACRVCGCVEDDCRLCVERTGVPCFWTAPDLCSACDPHAS